MQKRKATRGQQTVIRATMVKRSRTRVPSRSSVSGTWYILSNLRMKGTVRVPDSRAGGPVVTLRSCTIQNLAMLYSREYEETPKFLQFLSCVGKTDSESQGNAQLQFLREDNELDLYSDKT